MPTGYTAKLCEQEVPFAEFAMTCARAMGACVIMRDEPLDAPIPEEFGGDDYHAKALLEWTAKLQVLIDMGEGSVAINYGSEQKAVEIKTLLESLAKYEAQDARLKAMLEKVKAWTPPTNDHEGLKTFMEQQLTVSMGDSNFYRDRINEVQEKSAIDFYREAVKSARWNVSYHTEAQAKDAERNKGRTDWVKQLRASLQ